MDDNGKKRVKIRFDIFNDGTMNNRSNTDARLVTQLNKEQKENAGKAEKDKKHYLTDEERKAALDLNAKITDEDRKKAAKAYNKYGAPPPDDSDNSYEGYYTNIVRMERNVDTTHGQGYKYKFKSYVEGVGTDDNEDDSLRGFAFGAGGTGILAKVEKGISDVVQQITNGVTMDLNDLIIDEVTVGVYGFSRGAAVARRLIHELLISLRRRLKKAGYIVITTKVCFAGLYDTVSTYASGITDAIEIHRGHANNVRALNLCAVKEAEEALHLVAADEHRFHFSLTDIRSAIAASTGKQYFLPGAHSDIGGGYRAGGSENQHLLGYTDLGDALLQGGHASAQEIENDLRQLIAAGWYRVRVAGRKDEISVENNDFYMTDGRGKMHLVERRTLVAERNNIGNGYSQIPLHIMARHACGKGLILGARFGKDEAVPAELSDVQKRIDSYVAGTSKSRVTDWQHNEPWLRKLRHDYLHFSARMKTGHDPRINDNKQRTRMTYDG